MFAGFFLTCDQQFHAGFLCLQLPHFLYYLVSLSLHLFHSVHYNFMSFLFLSSFSFRIFLFPFTFLLFSFLSFSISIYFLLFKLSFHFIPSLSIYFLLFSSLLFSFLLFLIFSFYENEMRIVDAYCKILFTCWHRTEGVCSRNCPHRPGPLQAFSGSKLVQ